MGYVKPVPRNVYIYGDRFGPWPNEKPLPPERGARPLNPRTRPWPMFKQGPRGPVKAPRYIPRINRIPYPAPMPGRLPPIPALRYPPRFVPVAVPWIAPLLPLIPTLIPEVWPTRRPGLIPAPGSNVKVTFVRDCGGNLTWPDGQWLGYHSGLISNCLSNQAFPGGVAVPANQPNVIDVNQAQNPTSWVLCDPHSYSRVRNVRWWHGVGTGPLKLVPWTATPNPFPRPDPNEIRFQPAYPPEPDPYAPEPSRPPKPWEVPWYWTDAPPQAPPPAPHKRQPPDRNTKEKKVMSRAKKIGILLWNILDNVAEFSEIGAALYDALPAEIRARAGCPKPSAPTTSGYGATTNVGQYGSSMNGCMVQTLWTNWTLRPRSLTSPQWWSRIWRSARSTAYSRNSIRRGSRLRERSSLTLCRV